MARSTATAVKSSGPISGFPSAGMFVFDGNKALAYNSHWTIGRAIQAVFMLAMLAVGFIVYAEIRFAYAPSAYFNASPTAMILEEWQRQN